MISAVPEFAALAQSANVDPARMGAAFNDPANFFEHMTLEELDRIRESCARFAVLQKELHAALEIFTAYAKGYLAARKTETETK